MTEAEFWTLILTVPPHDIPDDIGARAVDEDLTAFTIALSKLPDADLIEFFHLFSSRLHALDTPDHYKNCIVGGEQTSSDVFLYARCHVLSLGPERYRDVLNTPALFPEDMWFEDVLGAVNEAYDRVWARDPNPDAHPSYESFSNVAWSKI